MSSISKFVWIEYADSKRHSNKLVRVEDLKVLEGGPEQFISRYIYSDSTAHIAGGKVASPMYFDFDSEDDRPLAQAEAKQCVHHFLDRSVDEFFTKIRFTGNKGFSVEIPFPYFGVAPQKKSHGAKLNLYWRRIAEKLRDEYGWKTMDTSVYDRRRMWRLTNTIHAKSNLFKIPLSLDELEDMNIDEIMDLAQNMRPYKRVYDTEKSVLDLTPIPILEELFEEAKKEVDTEARRNKKRFKEKAAVDFSEDSVFPCVQERIAQGVDLTEGSFRREPTGFLVAVALKSLGAPDAYIVQRLNEFFDNCQPPLPNDRREKDIPNILKQVRRTDYATHCKTPCFEVLCEKGRMKNSCYIFASKDQALPIETREQFTDEDKAVADNILAGVPLEYVLGSLEDIYQEEKLKVPLFLLELAAEDVRVSGDSSTGKSHIVDIVMDCFPYHWWKKVTGGSDRFLRYLPDHIRTLYIAEFSALRIGKDGEEAVAEYDMKIMMSEGKLKTPVVEKVEGKFVTVERETHVENFITTTTQVNASQELETRQWNIGTDRELTVPFVGWRADQMEMLPWERSDMKPNRRIIRCMMERIDEESPKSWIVPFMSQIVEPLVRVGVPRVRRDVEKLEKFIKAVAALNYKNRPVVRHEGWDDVGIVLPIDFYVSMLYGDEAIFSTLTEMTKRERQAWESIIRLHEGGKLITSQSLGALLNLSERQSRKWLKKFVNSGKLAMTREGVKYLYQIPEHQSISTMENIWSIKVDELEKYTKSRIGTVLEPAERAKLKRHEAYANVVKVSLYVPSSDVPEFDELPDAPKTPKQALNRLRKPIDVDNLDLEEMSVLQLAKELEKLPWNREKVEKKLKKVTFKRKKE